MALGRICAGCLVGCLAFSAVVSAKTDLTNLKVEYQKTPLGIEVMKPRFSWQMVADDNQRGWKQTAYEISVTDERGKLVWNSGKVESDNSLNIAYTGEPLSPATRYVWSLNVWNQKRAQQWQLSILFALDRIHRHAWISKALSDRGMSDVAYRLLSQDTFPSWLYPVKNGATTVWERLNSYTIKDGFGKNNSMNSFNHYSFGAVVAWMYNYSLGIKRDENSPGFKHFILQPEVDTTGHLTFAQGHYDSMYGRIESRWEQKANATTYAFTIPDNTSATVILTAPSLKSVKWDGKRLNRQLTKAMFDKQKKQIRLELTSGRYELLTGKE